MLPTILFSKVTLISSQFESLKSRRPVDRTGIVGSEVFPSTLKKVSPVEPVSQYAQLRETKAPFRHLHEATGSGVPHPDLAEVDFLRRDSRHRTV
jgi:hypothetical protein